MADHTSLRFGVLDLPNAPFPVLAERWRVIEELGFNFLWAPDHTAYWRKLDSPWFDGTTTLATMAAHTRRVRIGSLVANPILRHPVVLARQAAAVDHLSGGRLELGIGTGIAGFDHDAVGSAYWQPSLTSAGCRRWTPRRATSSVTGSTEAGILRPMPPCGAS